MAKLNPQSWNDKTLPERVAAIMFPQNARPEDRAFVEKVSRADGKRNPTGSPKLFPDHSRGATSPLGGQGSGWGGPKGKRK